MATACRRRYQVVGMNNTTIMNKYMAQSKMTEYVTPQSSLSGRRRRRRCSNNPSLADGSSLVFGVGLLLLVFSSTVAVDGAVTTSHAAYVSIPSMRPPRGHHRRSTPGRARTAVSASSNGHGGTQTNNYDTINSVSAKTGVSSKKQISWLNRNSKSSRPPLPYVRIQKRGRNFEVQTAITTFRKQSAANNGKSLSVDLHAQIHFGDESYFEYFNNEKTFGSTYYDKVLYELIVEDNLLSSTTTTTNNDGLRTLTPVPGYLNPIAPTDSDRSTASQYGLRCQVDAINYCRENWVHADLTREEFLARMEQGQPSSSASSLEQSAIGADHHQQQQQQQQRLTSPNSSKQPLWALASTSATYPGSEVVTAFLRPLGGNNPSASATLTRRLFTHLFLPGDALSGWIRAALWCGVPSPELSIMLVDWSSLSYSVGRRRSTSGSGNSNSNNITPISPIAAPVLLSLLTGNWGTARRLVFGQVLVGGQSNSDTSKNGVLIQARNERAMDVLNDYVNVARAENEKSNNSEQSKRVALLYGAGHCRDLHRRLMDEGMVPVQTEWRTAFRATAPRWGDYFEMGDWAAKSKHVTSSLRSSSDLNRLGEGVLKSMSVSTLESVAVGIVVLPLYLLVGGLDWVSTIGELGSSLDGGLYADGMAAVFLYLLRHVALYVAISKFVVDWGGNEGIFEDEDKM